MCAADPRRRRLRRMAWLTLGLLLAVTCLSAFLRHHAAGLSCDPWPACFGQGERAAADAVVVGGQALTVARASHRITATLALLTIALLLALLGVFTPGSRLPIVAIGNVVGGFVMLAIAARLVAPALPRDRALGLGAIGVALLLLAQIVGGALVSASQAGPACSSIRECAEQSSVAGWDWPSLVPWREAAFAVGTPHPEGALAQLLHRLASLVVAPAAVGLGVFALRRGRRSEGIALLLLLMSVVALGLAVGSTGLPLVPVLLHNLATALLLAVVLRLT